MADNPLAAVLPPPYRLFYEFLKLGGFFKGGKGPKPIPLTPQQEIEEALRDFAIQGVPEGGTEGVDAKYDALLAKAYEIGDQGIIDMALNAAPDEATKQAAIQNQRDRGAPTREDYPNLSDAQVRAAAEQHKQAVDVYNQTANRNPSQEELVEAQSVLKGRVAEILTNIGVPFDLASLDPINVTDKNGIVRSRVNPASTSNGSLVDVATQAPPVIGGPTAPTATVNLPDVATGQPPAQAPAPVQPQTPTSVSGPTAPTATVNLPDVATGQPTPQPTAPAETEQQKAARIRSEVQSVLENESMNEQAKIQAVEKISTDNGISGREALVAIVGGGLVGGALGGLFSRGGSGGSGVGGNTGSGGNTSTNSGGDGGITTPQVIAGLTSLLGTWLGYKGAGDAADAQAKAAQRALDIFERNAGVSVNRLRETTGQAISTIQQGAAQSRADINTGADNARDILIQGGQMGRNDVITARDNATQTLLTSLGLQKEEITNTALAASGLISAARERAAGEITKGFGDAITQIGTSRDISNKILQDSLKTAEEKLDVSRASAIAAQERGVKAVRSDFQPYIDAGKLTVENVSKLVNDPVAQRDFIVSNPFFDALAKRSEDALLKAKASVGKVGTGGTQIELQNEMLAIGNQLLDAAINRSLPLVQGGQNAAAQVAEAERQRANAVAQIEQSVGQSLAQLVQNTAVNRANVEQNAGNRIADLNVNRGTSLADLATQEGRDLAAIESKRGTDITNATSGTGSQIAQTQLNAGTNLADIATGTAARLGDNFNTQGTNLANINTASTDAQARLTSNLGVNESNILTGNAANTAETLIGQGNAQAAGIVGQTNALTGGLLNLGTIALNPTKFGATA